MLLSRGDLLGSWFCGRCRRRRRRRGRRIRISGRNFAAKLNPPTIEVVAAHSQGIALCELVFVVARELGVQLVSNIAACVGVKHLHVVLLERAVKGSSVSRPIPQIDRAFREGKRAFDHASVVDTLVRILAFAILDPLERVANRDFALVLFKNGVALLDDRRGLRLHILREEHIELLLLGVFGLRDTINLVALVNRENDAFNVAVGVGYIVLCDDLIGRNNEVSGLSNFALVLLLDVGANPFALGIRAHKGDEVGERNLFALISGVVVARLFVVVMPMKFDGLGFLRSCTRGRCWLASGGCRQKCRHQSDEKTCGYK